MASCSGSVTMGVSGPAPLTNDPAREAVGSLRGYSYQMLRSIDAWLDLAEGEILVLEGAEDLDRVSPHRVVVEQVKETVRSGNITLRGANALAAIGNFWLHRQRNDGIPIEFRYLTTSGIGQERDAALMLSVPGIEAWERIRQLPSSASPPADAVAIHAFLADREELPQAMREWLKSVSTELFINCVVKPFAWVTDQPGGDALRRTVEARLIELGESRGVSAAESVRALGELHLAAWENVTDAKRPSLRRGDLLRIFDAATTTTIPTAQLLTMIRQLAGSGAPSAAVAHVERTMVAPPQASARRFGRTALEESIVRALDRGTAWIHGSTGTGKTGLAVAAVMGRRGVGWIDLRDCDVLAVAARLHAAYDIIMSSGALSTVVLDDLVAGDDPRPLLPALSRLITAVAGAGGALLITSSQCPPPRLATALALAEDSIFEAPPFDDAEIAAFFAAEGCPADQVRTWSKIVYGSTSGHPQLVDARLGALQAAGWPKPSISELFTPPAELVDVRSEARRMVAALPASEREMLCRASLIAGRVSRQRLLAIAGIGPAVPEPGHVIDRLTGPWLERTETADLRASPLLRNLGIEVRGMQWSRDMHGAIAWAWLVDKSLTASDIFALLMHSIVAGRAGPLVHLLPSLMRAPADVWQQIGEAASMFATVGVGTGQSLPFANAVDRTAFRIVQLRIAMELDAFKVEAVVDQALREADERDDQDVGSEFLELMFMWQLLRKSGPNLSLRQLVDYGARFVRLGDRVRSSLLANEQVDSNALGEWPDLTGLLMLPLIQSVTHVDRLIELLDVLDEIGEGERRQILQGYAGDAGGAVLALDRIWVGEADRLMPDWPKCVSSFRRTIDVALAHGIGALANAAASLLVRVVDENQGDGAGAILEADILIARLAASPRLVVAKAKVMWRLGEAAASLPLYEDALSRFDLPRPWLTDALREAGIAAARAGDWPLCASRFRAAVPSSTEPEHIARRVGLKFDYGLALHLAGESRQAVIAFGDAIAEQIEDGQALPPEPLCSVRQTGSHAIKLVREHLDDRDGVAVAAMATFIGRSSSLATLDWGDQRPASLDIIANMLIELDLLVPGVPSVAIRISPWLRRSTDTLTMTVAGTNLVRLALATGDVEPIISDTIKQLAYLARAMAAHDAGREFFERLPEDPPLPPLDAKARELIITNVLACVVVLMAAGRLAEIPLTRWRADLPSTSSYGEIRAFFDRIEILMLGQDDPWPKVADASLNEDWQTHALAVLGALRTRRDPAQLIMAHALAGRYLAQPLLRELTSRPFEDLVVSAWLDYCDMPEQLVAPRLTVPAIQSAANSTASGWPRTKAVLREALLAVAPSIARMVRPHVEEL